MKKTLVFLIISLLIISVGCNKIKYGELFEITDEFVEKLNSSYQSYGLFGGLDDTKYTKSHEYQVLPVGRLINVRIERYADNREYEKLRKALESQYSNDYRVCKVYRCQAGTIMIDCRH